MIELLFTIPMIVLTLTGAGWFLKVEWDQGRCAYITFEKTHAQLTGSSPLSGANLSASAYGGRVQIQVSPESVQGSADCGSSTEQVGLPQLDPQSDPGSQPVPEMTPL
jgi:hypothetical protein